MSVEFDDQKSQALLYTKLLEKEERAFSLIKWLLRKGIAKTPESANHILVAVAIACLVIAAVVWYFAYIADDRIPTPEQARELEMQNQNLPPIIIKPIKHRI